MRVTKSKESAADKTQRHRQTQRHREAGDTRHGQGMAEANNVFGLWWAQAGMGTNCVPDWAWLLL